MDRARVFFLVKFAVTIVVLYVIIALKPVDTHVITPYTEFITAVAGKMLVAIGEPVTVQQTIIRSDRFAVDVENGCNGIEALVLLIAAIGAFPARWSQRIAGIIGGFIAIQLVNTFRVAMLFWLGAHHRSVFDLFHVAVWQSVIVLFSVALFLLWSWKFATPQTAASRA